MRQPNDGPAAFRAGLVAALQAAAETEREVFAAVAPAERDVPPADGGWSPKDVLAHLAAWRGHQVARMRAVREGHDEPADGRETDAINAVIHAERANWTWARVLRDAEATADALLAEVEAASDDTLANDRINGTIMGNGPEHELTHLSGVAARGGLEGRVGALADTIVTIVDRGGWPDRAAAYARYNLACFHALGGRLDAARDLLRQALAEREDLRAFAPDDADLIALRDELPTLLDG
jgi:hypothetical protein